MALELPALLDVAVERKYLDEAAAAKLAAEARRTGRPLEALLLEKGGLSERRVERLVTHVKYRSLRKADKAYAKAGVKAGLIDEGQVKGALDLQRRRFEERRDCLRLGTILVKQGHITAEQDKQIRTRVAKISQTTSNASGHAPALDDSASRGSGSIESAPTYDAIDSAMARVEAARRIQEDLSESVKKSGEGKATADSAEDFENACVMLARRRVQGGSKSGIRATA